LCSGIRNVLYMISPTLQLILQARASFFIVDSLLIPITLTLNPINSKYSATFLPLAISPTCDRNVVRIRYIRRPTRWMRGGIPIRLASTVPSHFPTTVNVRTYRYAPSVRPTCIYTHICTRNSIQTSIEPPRSLFQTNRRFSCFKWHLTNSKAYLDTVIPPYWLDHPT
jgi:hypothetical protein